MSELVLTPTKVLTEGTGTSHAPYIVASDLSSGQSVIAWSDGDDASYGKCDAGRSSRGNYPLWSDVDPTIPAASVTAIGVRFRAKSSDVDHFVVQLFGQTSRLLSDPFIGGETPLHFDAVDTWQDFDYVVAAADYDTAGWAPDGVQSALAETFIYCRTKPTDSTGEFTGSGVLEIAEQSIVLYYGVDLPCDTWVDLDLSTAAFLGTEAVPDGFGQYGDGVIYTIDGQYPDFYFSGIALDATKRYRVEVTYDPSSGHDAGGREVSMRNVRPGSELADYRLTHDSGPGAWLYDTGFPTTGDVQTFTIGAGVPRGSGIDPDTPGWGDATYGVTAGYTVPWFETDAEGAVSGIRIRKVCKPYAPLRQYPRPTLRVYPAPQTIQSGLRRGPSAII